MGGVNFRSVQPIPRSWNRENFVTGVDVLDIGAGLSDKHAGRNFRQRNQKTFDGPELELELELIQTHMVQKPMLRVEGEKSAGVLGVLV